MIFWQLLKTDLILLAQTIKNKLVNFSIWATATLVVSGYVLQAFGASEFFGVFQVGSVIVSATGFEVYQQLFNLIADFEGQKHINYYLTLPASNLTVLGAKVTFFAINGMLLSVAILPLSKLVLWNKISLTAINYSKLLPALILVNIFFGWFTIFMTTIVKNMAQIDDATMRVLFPIWFFGCFQYSLKTAYSISPYLWMISLLSPYSYATEAVRNSMLNPEDYLPYWNSMTVLFLMTVACGVVSYRRLKRKLDFV